ncbi:hypothetical protein ACFWY6_43775 [Streptomyces sp. NPDC059037]
MIIPFVVGVTVLLTVAAVGVWVCLEFCAACRERRRTPVGPATDGR